MPALPSTAAAIAAAVRSGALRAADVAAASLDRCRRLDPELGCFVELWPDDALAAAEAVDQARAQGARVGPLAGVPVAVKDNLLVRGKVAACGSRMLEHFVSPYDSAAVERLRRAGAVLLGRTNMDEFGMGSSTERSSFGTTRNPHARDRVPGGSSGGSAAAVAADLCPLALGSDTGGSVRQPAALCGVLGLKPTYGRISRWGLVAYASSLDTVGLLARTAGDLALALPVLAGQDPRDATSAAARVPDLAAAAAASDLRGLRVGLVGEAFAAGTEPDSAALVREGARTLGELGARIHEVELPGLPLALPAYYLIAAAEASANLARYDGLRYGLRRETSGLLENVVAESRSAGFGEEVRLRILLGTFALRAGYQDEFYGKATRARTLLRRDFERAFSGCDLLLLPTSPFPAFPLGSRTDDPTAMFACDLLTVPASLAGLPAMSLPVGADARGLPVGMQLVAPPLREDLLLAAAAAFQRRTDHHLRRPLP